MNNIPIYRAKKIDSDAWVEGILLPYLKRFNNKSFIINDYTRMQDLDNTLQIDPKTLSIHFNNMIDKNGKKIFASLSKDWIGGDIVKSRGMELVAVFDGKNGVELRHTSFNGMSFQSLSDIEVVGIRK